MLDVSVTLIRDGVVVNGSGGNMEKSSGTTAALGKAVLGKMVLGKS